MDLGSILAGVAVIVAIILFIIYYIASRGERGKDPQYAREVYLCYDEASDPRETAAAHNATLATEAQVAVYVAAGGEAHAPSPACGVWLYGPKPRLETPHVEPFNCKYWFQPL